MKEKLFKDQRVFAKGIYEDCGDQEECNFEENIRPAKIFSKFMRKLDNLFENNVLTNVHNIQHKEKDGEKQNLYCSYMCKWIECLKCKECGCQ